MTLEVMMNVREFQSILLWGELFKSLSSIISGYHVVFEELWVTIAILNSVT